MLKAQSTHFNRDFFNQFPVFLGVEFCRGKLFVSHVTLRGFGSVFFTHFGPADMFELMRVPMGYASLAGCARNSLGVTMAIIVIARNAFGFCFPFSRLVSQMGFVPSW